MSKFDLQHHTEIAHTIRDWIRLNPDLNANHIRSLINGFIITFIADSTRFNRYRFEGEIDHKEQP